MSWTALAWGCGAMGIGFGVAAFQARGERWRQIVALLTDMRDRVPPAETGEPPHA